MSKINDGGSAFPCELHSVEGVQLIAKFPGMSLRDYFAGQALAGTLACFREFEGCENIRGRVEMAYKHADAMLAERAKEQS